MELEEIKRGLRAEIKKRENEQYATFQCNVRQMCKDVLAKLEYQESVIAEKDKEIAELEDAGMRERRLRRALYKALANWAHFAVAFFSSFKTKDKWHKMEHKCLKKAEEYK